MKIIKDTREKLEKFAVDLIQEKITETLNQKDGFNLFLTGGNSVTGILDLLTESQIDWNRVQIFLTDERVVPITDPESNFNKLQNDLFSKINIPAENLHPINFTDEKFFNASVPDPDLIILSSGPDGHIASLFPNHESFLNDELGYIKVTDSPKPPSDRVSLSRESIKLAKTAIGLFFGADRQNVFSKFADAPELPVNLLTKISESYVLSDMVE